MKILHAPNNIVNIPFLISKATKKLGYTCETMTFNKYHYNDASDYVIFPGKTKIEKLELYRKLKLVSFMTYALMKYDVFQFHTRVSFLPNHFDTDLIVNLKKKYFIYHHGSDVIGNQNYLKHVPHSKNAVEIFISTPDLFDCTPKSSILIPQAIDCNYLEKISTINKNYNKGPSDSFLITHAINREGAYNHKGSEIIINAIEDLKKRGLKINFKFFIGENHETVLKEIAKSDLHIDQMKIGWYGTISAEAMALGTPSACFIRPDLEKYSKNLPIIRLNKSNITKTIENIILDGDKRKNISQQGIDYVMKTHNASVIAKRLLKFYED